MAKVSASKKIKRQKSSKVVRPAERSRPKPASKSSRTAAALKRKAPPKSPKRAKAVGGKAKAPMSSHRPARKGTSRAEAEHRKAAARPAVVAPPAPPPRLLRHTKTTSAALALMEKGIEYIYKKDYKRARAELKSLLESYPSEAEILARARSYLRICDREEALQKRQAVTSDQYYALGVMEHNRGNYDEAISYFLRSLEKHPDADYIYYSVAASLAMKGDLNGSIDNLRKAIELNEDSRVHAKTTRFLRPANKKRIRRVGRIRQTTSGEMQ
jgi:tetratricopeptide (TPR) repeat protein